ncbi:hypothetical protein PHET_04980 [Paragonimus heterotremus]|uniref:Uncharacterized protein n=1 Tax=Paragonimus heterotremus TaxID=100268 RepID=A0A8J4TL87_9TREM|nr:hypothetical protein PHET_04980 [Paragonimus heterotremus]
MRSPIDLAALAFTSNNYPALSSLKIRDDQSTKDDSKRVGRKKHPPPPTSPPYQRPSRKNVEDPNDYLPVLHIEDPGAGM